MCQPTLVVGEVLVCVVAAKSDGKWYSRIIQKAVENTSNIPVSGVKLQ